MLSCQLQILADDNVITEAATYLNCTVLGVTGVKYVVGIPLSSFEGVLGTAVLGTEGYIALTSPSQTTRAVACLGGILTAFGLTRLKQALG